MSTQTVRLHRILTASPEKVFRAFIESDAIASWLPPYGFICTVHQLEAHLNGTYKMAFRNFTTGASQSFGGTYIQFEPNALLQYTNRFDDPNMPGEMLTTIHVKAVSCGTELAITQEGIPAFIPAEMCYLGWQESLEKLKKLVEPHIPEA